MFLESSKEHPSLGTEQCGRQREQQGSWGDTYSLTTLSSLLPSPSWGTFCPPSSVCWCSCSPISQCSQERFWGSFPISPLSSPNSCAPGGAYPSPYSSLCSIPVGSGVLRSEVHVWIPSACFPSVSLIPSSIEHVQNPTNQLRAGRGVCRVG